MANTTTTPNMFLIVPTVGQDPGPDFAFNVNSSLTLIDQHDHSPGKGVLITPAGININAALSFNGNPATNVSYLGLYGTVSPTTSPSTALQSVSVGTAGSINELYYTDSNGTQTQITKNGTVNVVASSIPGESYAAGTFYWTQTQSGLPTTPANFSIGSITLQPNIASTAFGVQLVPPSAATTSFTFPNFSAAITGSVPSSTSFMQMDTSGNITASATPIAATAGYSLKNSGSAAVWRPSYPTQQVFTSGTGTYTTPTNCVGIKIRMIGGGGGGGGCSNSGATAGTTGGNTVFNASIVASGGSGGGAGTASILGAAGIPVANTGVTGVSILGGYGGRGDLQSNGSAGYAGGSGGNGAFGGGAGANTAGNSGSNGFNGSPNSGGGGGGAPSTNLTLYFSGGGGASGSYVEQVINTPAATYSYSVGSGGPAGTGSGGNGGSGGSGIIIVDEYY